MNKYSKEGSNHGNPHSGWVAASRPYGAESRLKPRSNKPCVSCETQGHLTRLLRTWVGRTRGGNLGEGGTVFHPIRTNANRRLHGENSTRRSNTASEQSEQSPALRPTTLHP